MTCILLKSPYTRIILFKIIAGLHEEPFLQYIFWWETEALFAVYPFYTFILKPQDDFLTVR